jgi:hypothetical protein
MPSTEKNQNLSGSLANCCIFAGISLLFSNATSLTQVMLPIRELTYSDFLVAAGMVPYLATSLALLVRQAAHPLQH